MVGYKFTKLGSYDHIMAQKVQEQENEQTGEVGFTRQKKEEIISRGEH